MADPCRPGSDDRGRAAERHQPQVRDQIRLARPETKHAHAREQAEQRQRRRLRDAEEHQERAIEAVDV